jgi:hypothetical protein
VTPWIIDLRRIARDGGVSGSCARLRLAKASGEALENAPDVARFLRTLVGVAGAAVCAPALALAQAGGDRSDAGLDADDARNAAILGTFNLATPEPFGNLYSTAPGAEQQAVMPSFRFYTLLPLNFDSNAETLSYGGVQSWGTFPVANLSAVPAKFSSRRGPESAISGHVTQCPPPRPRPSSEPEIVVTSIPSLRSSVFVYALRS